MAGWPWLLNIGRRLPRAGKPPPRFWALGLLGASVGLLELAAPAAVHSPTLRATAETVMTLAALACAWLLGAQFRRSRRLRDLLLLVALLMLALVDFGSFALPAAIGLRSGSLFTAAPMLGSTFIAVTLAAAAFTPRDWLVGPARWPLGRSVWLSVAALAAAGLGGVLLSDWLVNPGGGNAQGLAAAAAHPLALFLAVGGSAVLACAAVGFARADRGDAGVGALLAAAMILLAGARLYYLALPALAPDWIAPREALRLVAIILIFAAVVRRSRESSQALERGALTAERRRLARDLHDGLAQDLAFIAAHGQQIAHDAGTEHPIAIAARRALALSRGALVDLSAQHESTVRGALLCVAEELAERFELTIHVDAPRDAELPTAAREHVVRIVREAIVNAAKHGGARAVVVSLVCSDGGGFVLRVRDDGCGIGSGATSSHPGFGMKSMRERAAALGGRLAAHHVHEGGTELEVVLP